MRLQHGAGDKRQLNQLHNGNTTVTAAAEPSGGSPLSLASAAGFRLRGMGKEERLLGLCTYS